MRRGLALVALALLAMGVFGPTLDALVPCSVPCADESPAGDCGSDQCCSCCVHTKAVEALAAQAESLAPSAVLTAAPAARRAPGAPRGILHVPKPRV